VEILGWIVRTGEPGSVQYWKVGAPDPKRAAAIAAEAAGVPTAKAIARIGVWAANEPGSAFALISGTAIEMWARGRRRRTHEPLDPTTMALASSESFGQISFDTELSDDDNEHMEGSYRLTSGDWKVFYFTHHHHGKMWMGEKNIRHDFMFSGGVIGTDSIFPTTEKLNKHTVVDIFTQLTGVKYWVEVIGPDSLILK
jgi:hypothetical protein